MNELTNDMLVKVKKILEDDSFDTDGPYLAYYNGVMYESKEAFAMALHEEDNKQEEK